jgi:Flp pilus assembly protein TadB
LGESILFLCLAVATCFYLGPILGATLLGIVYHVRGLALSWIIESREKLLRSQTLALAIGLQGLVRGGLVLSSAFESLAHETPLPLGKQISKVSFEFRRGRPLIEALNAVRAKLRLDAFSLLAELP